MKIYRLFQVALFSAALTSIAVHGDRNLCDVNEDVPPTPNPTTLKPTTTSVPVVSPAVIAEDISSNAPMTQAPAAPSAQGPVDLSTQDSSAPSTQAPTPVMAPSGSSQTNPGSVKASFSYQGKNAGGPGSYMMVKDYVGCNKVQRDMSNPISPLDDDVTIVFRGPLNIYNIAVFDGSSGSWKKVSSYENEGKAENMIFFNNKNVDFGGQSAPVGFSSSDGRSVVSQPTPFKGFLGAATDPDGQSIFPDEKTGAEVHIMTSQRCGVDAECVGYYDKDGTAYKGWGGAKKIFITKVDMPHGNKPDLPAIWMLNGQVVRSNQYQCNCRGIGKAGGCGELDIAEVLEKDTNVVATHYYFYNGEPAPGHDRWGQRPVNAATIYITIIDESYGVKVLEIGQNDFDFSSGSISQEVVSNWLSA
jgi:hypothetical protein